MMTYTQLRSALSIPDAELDQLYEAFQSAHQSPNTSRFLASLYAESRIDADTFQALDDSIVNGTRVDDSFLRKFRFQRIALLSLVLLIVAAVFWNQQQQEAAEAQSKERERALGVFLTDASNNASNIDEAFLKYQGLLQGLASAAELAIQPTTEEVDYYLEADFSNPATQPDDLAPSPIYQKDISTQWPVVRTMPELNPEQRRSAAARLARLRAPLRQTLIHSIQQDIADDAVDRHIRDVGAPVVWAFVSDRDGNHTAFPGKSGYPDDYDPRVRPWYSLADQGRGPQCGNPYDDAMGQGLLLPCTMNITDADGQHLGVAGLELTFQFIIDNLLTVSDTPGVDRALLLDAKGHILIDSQHADPPATDSGHQRFGVETVLESILRQESGYEEFTEPPHRMLVAYNRMNTLGWYHVVMGPRQIILGEEQP